MNRKVRYGMMVLLALGFGVVFLLGASRGERQEQEASRARLRGLLVERQELLESTADTLELQVDYGRATYADYGWARAKALKAKLDLVELPTERIEIYEKIVAFYKELEKTAKSAKDDNRLTALQFNKIKIRRLEAEIKLMRERMKK